MTQFFIGSEDTVTNYIITSFLKHRTQTGLIVKKIYIKKKICIYIIWPTWLDFTSAILTTKRDLEMAT